MLNRWTRPLALTIIVTVLGLFFANIASWVAVNSLCCGDDAMHAVVAKNLAFDRGYISSYPDPVLPEGVVTQFDPRVSLGPTMIFPTAVFIKILGNEYWVPGAATLVLIIGLLIGLIWEIDRRAGSPLATVVFVLVLLLLLNLTTIAHFEQWYALLGEIPATLLAVLGFAFITRKEAKLRDLTIGGALFALALLTKTIITITIPVAVLGLWWTTNSPRGRWFRPSHPLVARLLIFSIGILLPILAFELYKLFHVGGEAYLAVKQSELSFIAHHGGSGGQTLSSNQPWQEVANTASRNWNGLANYFKGAPFAIVALVGALLPPLLAARCKCDLGRFAILLSAAFWLHFLWWLVLSNTGWIRHLLPALFLLSTAMATLAATGVSRPARGLVLVIAIASFAARGLELSRNLSPTPWFSPAERAQAMLMAKDVLAKARQDYPLVADWWASAVDMEYLFDERSNFTHINHIWKAGNQCALLYRYNWIFSPNVRKHWDEITAACNKITLLDRPPYHSVSLCCR